MWEDDAVQTIMSSKEKEKISAAIVLSSEKINRYPTIDLIYKWQEAQESIFVDSETNQFNRVNIFFAAVL